MKKTNILSWLYIVKSVQKFAVWKVHIQNFKKRILILKYIYQNNKFNKKRERYIFCR